MKILMQESNYTDLEDVVEMRNAVLYRGTASLSYRDKMLSKDLTLNSEGECGFATSVSAALGYGYAVVEFRLSGALCLKKTDNPSREDYSFLLSRGVDGLLWRDFVIMISLDKLKSAKTQCIVSFDRSGSRSCIVPHDLSCDKLIRVKRQDFPSLVFIPSRMFDSKCAESSIVLCNTVPNGEVRICGTWENPVDADYGYIYGVGKKH